MCVLLFNHSFESCPSFYICFILTAFSIEHSTWSHKLKLLVVTLIRSTQIKTDLVPSIQKFFFQLIHHGPKKWTSSYWNWWDVIAIASYFVGFALRMANQRVEGRIVYAIDLMFFIVRILEVFLVDEDLGPYVVMIGRMVSNITMLKSKC